MTKGKWLARALHVTIALSFILGALVVAPSVSADPGTSKWERQGTPTDDDKVILPGSDIIDFDVTGSDGMTVYAIGTWQGQNVTCLGSDYVGYTPVPGPGELWAAAQIAKFWKSTDGGVTWTDKTSKVLDAKNLPNEGTSTALDWDDFMFFTAVSAAPDDPDFVVVTGWDHSYNAVVVGSSDGASKFYYMGCATATGIITCVDVSMEVDDKHVIAVGTWDWLSSPAYTTNNAAVWRYDAGGYWSAYWVQTGATTAVPTAGYTGWEPCDAIVDLEFSPNFDVDDSIVVLCIDEVNDINAASFPDSDADTGTTPDYLGFKLQAGTWNSIDAWNAAAEFDSYPVVIKNDDYSIVSPIDPTLGSGWDQVGALIRRAGDIDLPMDYMGDDNSDRKVMVVVNGVEFNMSSTPDEWIDDGGFLFWVENTTISLEMLDHEDNPYISSLDYQGNIDMEGRTLLGLAFPSSWRCDEIMDWFNGDGVGAEALPCCAGVQVLRSETTDVCCPDWDYAAKPPSGQFFATVMMTPDGDWAFAGTQGESWLSGTSGHSAGWWSDESAFSISGHSGDLGSCWNQESLIDTDIDFIADAVVNPACGYIYMLTINNVVVDAREGKVCECDSVWRSEDSGSTWLRIFHHELAPGPMDVDDYCLWGPGAGIEWGVLGLAPEEEDAVETIYLAELDTQFVWYADGSGLCKWTDRNTGLANIADIAVLDASTIYVVDFNGDLVKSTTNARHWSSIEESKVDDDTGEQAHTMVAWGDWVLLGGNMGTVSYSDDGADSFSVLDDIGGGQVHVAFDSYFDDNGYIYGAVAGADRGIWRTTIDGADFKDMNACTSMNYFGIVLSDPDGNPKTSASTGGVLYASYNSISAYDDCTDAGTPITCAVKSGVARLLNPASSSCCGALSWDYLWDSLDASAAFHTEPSDLALCGCLTANTDATLWAVALENESSSVVDTYFDGWNTCYTDLGASGSYVGRLWKYTDCFAKAGPALIGVDDGATIPSDPCDCVNEDFVLEWDRICDACEYDVEIALDEAFTHKVWNTSTICAGWSSVGCQLHEDCADMVLLPCESDMTFYKPSDPCVPSIVVPQGTLDCNQQYWWRVRARVAETGEIYRSQWSAKWSFTVAVGPGGAIKLTAPDDGASNVPLENIVFTWTAVADATSYEMTLMDASGAEVASNSGDATSFVLGSKLDYDSAYMWQVNALMGSNVLSESGASTFRTMSKPTAPPEIPETVINFPEPVTGTPTWVWVVIALAAILIIVVIVLIFRTRRV